ncbi:MAG: MGMT family protein [Candidatus Micrarchaeota archaeon]
MCKGKSFKSRVQSAARSIPPGQVSTYKALASAAGNPKASRTVGTIMHHNDIQSTHVPCHRVIKSSGELGGYVYGVNAKASMLCREGVDVQGTRVDLSRFFHAP